MPYGTSGSVSALAMGATTIAPPTSQHGWTSSPVASTSDPRFAEPFQSDCKCVPEAADRDGRSRPCSLWDELSFDSLAASDDLECSRHLGKGNAVGDELVAVQQPGRQHPDSSVQGVLQ